MQKIPTMFVRDPANLKLVLPEVAEGCEWVVAGEGVPTEKFDGSACLVRDGRLYKRYALKATKPKPEGWLHWSFDPAQHSGHGWYPVREGPEDLYHQEAWGNSRPEVGDTYELVGPKLQKNPHHLDVHMLWRHGSEVLVVPDRSHLALETWLAAARPMEGLVFHHPDGRMAKIKRRDFGLPWPVKE